MARLPGVPDSEIPQEMREIVEAQRKHYGCVLNSARQLAYAPRVAIGAAAMTRELARSRQIEPRLSALLNLRIAAIVGCGF
ncbi:hypothetical protein NET02_02295 [Thermomicrobiaceae bacterium CFH 74404]|uniref:Carboxymuconolactone decarboxylase-like domain-containing protein n=1 Tax=Thermalbibacter longus TaxID=2951981 RepID=A0AA41W9V2_9BACT|nr:hypothetical protein [Thermalbibacter longus]MCM8747971.1 hypothetical protein [Thermalbibacter longus]